jgi:hypothetical protein
VLIQVVFRNYKLDPLSSIAMYAPVSLGCIGIFTPAPCSTRRERILTPSQICVVLISACLPFTEGLAPFQQLDRVGVPLLLVNGLVAFALNVVGSLVLTLSGVLKVSSSSEERGRAKSAQSVVLMTQDTILVTAAWLLGSYITMMQVIGESCRNRSGARAHAQATLSR